MTKSVGGRRSGLAAVKNKTGIHGLTPEYKRHLAAKGRKTFREKWQNPDYRKLHADKVRLGKLAARLRKAFKKIPSPENAFGYDWH